MQRHNGFAPVSLQRITTRQINFVLNQRLLIDQTSDLSGSSALNVNERQKHETLCLVFN